jgi:hypothetical protein
MMRADSQAPSLSGISIRSFAIAVLCRVVFKREPLSDQSNTQQFEASERGSGQDLPMIPCMGVRSSVRPRSERPNMDCNK